MSRRDRDNYHEQRGRSNERSSHYSSTSRNDGRSQFTRPRHQQTTQSWQNGNYHQSATYNSNYQYQNRPRLNRPSTNYNHNSPWNQQWGGYNPPYQSSQWGLSNQQHVSPQNFTPHSQLPSYLTHQAQSQESGLSQKLKPTGNPNTSNATQNPPLGSKEYREKALEESKDRLKKSLRESLDRSPGNVERNDDNSVDQFSIATPDSDRSGPRPRTALVKTVRDSDKVGVSINSSSPSQKQIRRSSSDSNNRSSSESINPPKTSTLVNRRSRSTSLSSSTNSANSGTCTTNKQCLQSSVASKGQTSKEVHAAKQRVIKELLSMNRVKLKELVSFPRSRKIDMVMKYMIKESRAQQSHKQRQLAQAGMVGTSSESSNTLAQQDVEALLSDPDLHVSLSNLPTEMIETLGNIFKLNSLGDVESVNQGVVLSETADDLYNSGMNELCSNDVSIDLDSSDVGLGQNLGGSMKVEFKICEMFHDVKPDVDLGLCPLNVDSPDLCNPTSTVKFTSDGQLTDVSPSLDSVEASSSNVVLEPQTDCSEVSLTMISSYSEDIEDKPTVKRSDPVKDIPITFDSSSWELTDDVEKPELLEGLSALSASSKVITTSPTEPVDNFMIDPVQENRHSLTPDSMKNDFITPELIGETTRFPQQSQQLSSVLPKEMPAVPDFPQQFSMTLEPVEVPEDSLVACNSQENSHGLDLHTSFDAIHTGAPNNFTDPDSSSKTVEHTSVDLLSSEQINMTPEHNIDPDKSVSKHFESSLPSSIRKNLSETYIALSESKAKLTGTTFEEGNTAGTFDLVSICSEQNNVTTSPNHVEKFGMASENLVHDQVIKLPLDVPVPVVSGTPFAELSYVKDQESEVLKLDDGNESIVPINSIDISIPVGLQPECLEKRNDECDLSTPVISLDTNDCVKNDLRLAQGMPLASQKEIVSSEFDDQTPHQKCKSVSPERIMDQDGSIDPEKMNEQTALKPMGMETEDTVHGMGHRPMDPMCILYESLATIGSRHAELQQSFDISVPKSTGEHENDKVSILGMATECGHSVSGPEHTDSDRINATKVGIRNNHESGILTEMESIRVKSEREEIDIPTLGLYDHTPHLNVGLSEPLALPGTEVSTQTENSHYTTTNLTDILQLFKASCVNPSQEAAFNQLKELFMPETDSVDDSETPTRCTRIKPIQQKNTTNSKRHGPTKKLHRSTTASTSAQHSVTDPILLDTTFSEVGLNEESVHANIVTTSDLDEMGPQEKLKSLFHNITLIEKKIETWMEIKKKLYEKVNIILEDEKSQCSSSSDEKDTSVVEVTSSSKEHVISVSPLSSQLHKRRSASTKEVPSSNRPSRKKVDTSKSTSTLHSPISLPPEPRRVMRKSAASLDKTIDIDENVDSCCVTQSKVKKEILHSTSTDERSVLNESKSKRKKSLSPQKPKVITSRASLNTTVSSDKSSTTISPPLKRSFRNKPPNLGEKIDRELLTTIKSEDSRVRCSRRKVDKAPQVPVLSTKPDESLVRTSRRRIEKEIPVPVVLNLPEHDSARTNRRTRRYQANDANEEPVELCILSPNLSRRTKGERKEISAPTELQNMHAMADDIPSPRRATRQSIEPVIIQELPEVKRVKRKACEMENVEEPQSLPLLNAMRKCSVVLEPLAVHLNKKTKYSTFQDQSSGGLTEDSQLSEYEHGNESEMAEPNLDTDITSDEDDMPLFKIKQCINPNITAGTSVTKFLIEADHNSVSSSDTALDQGIDDLEIGGNTQHKSKKNKGKKSKKEKQYDHHSRNENLDFVDHNRGTILDIKIVGRHLLAASEDGFLYSYSMKSGKLKKKYEGHQAAVTCLCTIDGEKESEKSCPEKVVTGSLDDHVRCFLFKSAELIHAPLKIGTALCVDYNWGIVYLGTKLGEVAKINAKTFSLIGDHMKFSSESILSLKATKEGPRKVLIIGTRDQPISIRDADSGLFLRTVSGVWHHTVCSLLLDKSLVYCGTMSGPIPVFDFTNGQEMFRLQAGVGVRCVKIYNNLLFAGCYDGNIYIYNVKDQSLVQTILGSGKMVLCLDVTKNKVIYSCKDALKAINFPPEVSRALKDAKLK